MVHVSWPAKGQQSAENSGVFGDGFSVQVLGSRVILIFP